ncbi:class IV adenylate cyclase [bacterium]|nr:class IV adenylate cyclase [bacterium]
MIEAKVEGGEEHTNLEFKARVRDLAAFHAAAARLGAQDAGVLVQVDTYFKVPQGRLKLREINGTDAMLIYYDRSEDAAQRWSHFRVAKVVEPEGMKAVLSSANGLRGVVAKHRHLYLWQDCRIHLDQVEGLGDFIEFEVLSEGVACSDWDRMEALMTVFGLRDTDAIQASYSDLLGL